MKVLDLFSGIGGFSLGLERAGMETVAFCEIESYPQKVLAKHWPDVPIYNDVRELTVERLRQDGITDIDVLCGGFPCQDISAAGNQAGIGEGTRSGLWSECARLIGELQPRYAIFENVTALLSGDNGRWFQQVLWDISQVGYDAEWHCIPASELGAHHHRDRVWIIAYPNCTDGGNDRKSQMQRNGRMDKREAITDNNGIEEYVAYPNNNGSSATKGRGGSSQGNESSRAYPVKTSKSEGQCKMADTNRQGLQGLWQGRTIQEWCQTTGYSGQNGQSPGWSWATEPSVGRVANGVPQRSHRLKCLGNAVVPQIPELIGRAIMEAEGPKPDCGSWAELSKFF
tara:strand:+ start:1408 stop:2430 length:1023 start_codon:yes stop_codon:yes gene_type:complete